MIAVTTQPSVSSVLREAYGAEFERATQTERLVFLEAIAFSLRVDCEFYEGLALTVGTPPNMPASIYTPAKLGSTQWLLSQNRN